MSSKFGHFGTVILFALAFAFPSGVGADADKRDLERVEVDAEAHKDLKKFWAEYGLTGETKSCLSLNRIRTSRVLDDKTIFFETMGRKGYVTRLKNSCINLKAHERFAYRVSANRLCDYDIITVLDSFGREWGGCGLESFEAVEKIEKK